MSGWSVCADSAPSSPRFATPVDLDNRLGRRPFACPFSLTPVPPISIQLSAISRGHSSVISLMSRRSKMVGGSFFFFSPPPSGSQVLSPFSSPSHSIIAALADCLRIGFFFFFPFPPLLPFRPAFPEAY